MNAVATAESASIELISSAGESLALPGTAGDLLLRMFADPYLLQAQEREALEELREAVALAPDYFLAHLKLGELYMRLRIIERAAAETEAAGRLAEHPALPELARRQAAQIRGMRRHGILRTAFAFSSTSWLPWTLGRRALHPARKEGTRSCLPS